MYVCVRYVCVRYVYCVRGVCVCFRSHLGLIDVREQGYKKFLECLKKLRESLT